MNPTLAELAQRALDDSSPVQRDNESLMLNYLRCKVATDNYLAAVRDPRAVLALADRVAVLEGALSAICPKATQGYLMSMSSDDYRALLMEISDIARNAIAPKGHQ